MRVTRHPVLRRFWYPLMPERMLADGPKPFRLLGEDLVIWKDGEGRPAALADRCCHRTAKLSLGFYDEGRLACGYHGWCYDREGRCVKIPQFARDAIPAANRVPAYRAELRYGYVWVALEDPLAPIPDVPEAREPGWRFIEQFHAEWNTSPLRMMENMFDTAHFSFVHKGTFGDPDPVPVLPELEPGEYGFVFRSVVPVKNNALNQKLLGMGQAETVRRNHVNWWMPFCRRQRIEYPNGLVHMFMTLVAPVEDDRFVISQFAIRNDTEEDAPAEQVIAFDRQVTDEDRRVVETTDPFVPIADLQAERSMPSDRAGLLLRRMFRDLFIAHGEPVDV